MHHLRHFKMYFAVSLIAWICSHAVCTKLIITYFSSAKRV